MCMYNEKEAKLYNACDASCNAKSKFLEVGSATMSSVRCICDTGSN